MWQCLYPGGRPTKSPSAISPTASICWLDEGAGAPFLAAQNRACLGKQRHSAEFWQQMANPDFISDEEIWALRYNLRRELIEFSRRTPADPGQRLAQDDSSP